MSFDIMKSILVAEMTRGALRPSPPANGDLFAGTEHEKSDGQRAIAAEVRKREEARAATAGMLSDLPMFETERVEQTRLALGAQGMSVFGKAEN